MPKKASPLYVDNGRLLTLSLSWRSLNCSYSAWLWNKGSNRSTSTANSVPFSKRYNNVSKSKSQSPLLETAVPYAANKWECSGKSAVSSVKCSVSIKRCRNSERKCKGPPKNATCPLIGLPQASPAMVWLTTAWNIDAAKSSFFAPSLIKGCISVLANTPQREAIG